MGALARGRGVTQPTADSSGDLGRHVVAIVAAAYLPFAFLGYGTDIDNANVLRAGGELIEDGRYEISRRPGAFAHEVGTGVLDWVGGSVAINLASIAFGVLAVWSVYRLARSGRSRWPALSAALVATNPWFWIAATSLGDFVWAVGLAMAGALAASRDRRALAGVLFGLAVGCRLSSALIALSWIGAERLGAHSSRPPWRSTAITGGATVVVALAAFVPSWLDAGHSFDFLGHLPEYPGIAVNVGRWAVKNAAVIGVPAGLVLLAGVTQWARVGQRWSDSVVARFAILVVVTGELLFLRFPWKPLHLLPVVVGAALLIGLSPAVRRGWLVALVVAQLVGGLVTTTIAEPDVPHHARSGRPAVRLTDGPLLNDVRCRLDDRRDGPWPDPTDPAELPAALARAAVLFDCQSTTWKVVPPAK